MKVLKWKTTIIKKFNRLVNSSLDTIFQMISELGK